MDFGQVGTHQHNNQPINIANIDEVEQHTLAESMEIMLQQMPLDATKCSIYRVSKRLLNINSKAYTPQVISIGPFHHGREHLMAMERHKLRALKIFLRRINMRVEEIIAIARNWEREARECYAEPINMNHDDFVKMMLLDGCFLVEFMILYSYGLSPPPQILTLYCPFYESMWLHLSYDIMMLENQLPLFLLQALFNQLQARKDSAIGEISFMGLVQHFLECAYIKSKLTNEIVCNRNANHLVHLLSDYYSFLIDKDERENNNESEQGGFLIPPTLTELWEAGVTIKKATKEKHWMDISFENGVLEIPYFDIDDHFETRVRNLMAFEQYLRTDKNYVTNYVAFLDGLISTEKDASLVVKAEILTNNIGGSNEQVSKLFNDLGNEITLPGEKYYYYNMTKALIKYCKVPRHRWMASLRRDYFNTPWAAISFVAATLLIILTFIQTIYSCLSYSK